MPTEDQRQKKRHQPEPVGIVISGGPVIDTPPIISAYVWGPAPKQPRASSEPKAA